MAFRLEAMKPGLCFGFYVSPKTAYAEGNALTNRVCDSSGSSRSDGEAARQGPRRAAVSNKIEKLVETGDLSRKQAAKLHEIAQGVYDHVVEKLEAELDGTVK